MKADLKSASVSDYISELISLGFSSLARDDGNGNLDIYKNLDNGLEYLNQHTTVVSDDVTKSVVLLKLLIDLRENIISSKEVPDHAVPNIHKSADSLNKLLIKSAEKTILNEKRELITSQCEAFLKIADEIRNERKIRGLGILDGRLKNVIGRLRKKSGIESVFKSAENEFFENYKLEADSILEAGNLRQIGEKLLEMKDITRKKKANFTQINRFLKYKMRYEASFISRIKNQMNSLNKKSYCTSLYNIQENIEDLSGLIALEKYHKKKGMTLAVKRLINHIKKIRIDPLESALQKMIDTLGAKQSERDWDVYVARYESRYDETELFSDSFYAYTLKGMSVNEVLEQLQEKIKRLKTVELDKIAQINFENEIEMSLKKLMRVFENQRTQK